MFSYCLAILLLISKDFLNKEFVVNEKRYFVFWLMLDSLLPLILGTIQFLDSVSANNVMKTESLTMSELMEQPLSLFITGLLSAFVILLFSAITLAIGMYFAEKIGAKLLLLQGNYDLKKDILKPALIVGIAVSCIVFVVYMISPFELFSFFEKYSYFSFYTTLVVPITVIKHDIRLLLFWIAGVGLLIKRVTRSSSMDLIMYASIVLIAFLVNMSSPMWHFGTSLIFSSPMLVVGPVIRCGIDIVLGMLFWKKGFETAVLCHLIITFIFYMVTPMLLLR